MVVLSQLPHAIGCPLSVESNRDGWRGSAQLGKPWAHGRGNTGDTGKGEVNRIMSNLLGTMWKKFLPLPIDSR